MRDRAVLVTGAAGGIGRAVVEAFAGSRVIAVDRDEDSARRALEVLAPDDRERCFSVGVDLADPDALGTAVRAVRGFAKDVSVLVNVAGFADDAVFPMVSQASMARHMQVNFFAAVTLAQFGSRSMLRGDGGAIINVASITGLDANRGQLAYGASKAALINATRTMSLELGSRGIRVNAVAPGVIDTPMTQSLDAGALTALTQRPAMRRLGRPEEVAAVILWLASPAASYVTGQTIRVDGCI